MIQVKFRPPTESDLDFLAENMREHDVLECRLVGNVGPREALKQGAEGALWAYVALVKDEPIALFGVTPDGLLSDDASPWLLSIKGIERHAKVVMTCAPRFVAAMHESFERLSNVVHADNRSAIRFLKWCGFEFGETVEIGGAPFLPFGSVRTGQRKAA